MLPSQAINMTPQTQADGVKHGMKPGRRGARENGIFGEMMNKQTAATSPQKPPGAQGAQSPKEQPAVQPEAEEQPAEEAVDNLYTFPVSTQPTDPAPVVEQPDPTGEIGEKIWVPHPKLLLLTQALVSILEGYPNNKPVDTEIVPLLEEYARQLAELEQPVSPKIAELQALLEEVLARTPQNNQTIAETPQQTDKLLSLINMLRGNPSPLENVNEDISSKAPADIAEAEAILLKPVATEQKKSAAAEDGNAGQQPQRETKQAAATQHQQQQFRVDVAPHKVFFADQAGATATAPRFMPMTPESLFNTMVERIVALPGAEPHMEIALKPDHLGKLSIDLSLGEQGLTAKIIASDESVRNMLAAHVNRLSETLAEKGIRVENVEIVYSSLTDKQSSNQQSSRQEQGKSNSYRPALWGITESSAAGWDNLYAISPYTDEWGFSSVEYQA